MSKKLLAKYKNGNYRVLLFKDGTKIRYNDLDNLTPSFAESIDCTITTKCNGGCQWCYLGCNEQGKHADLNHPVLKTLHPGTELAINANDMSHPDLENFLRRMKEQGIIVNITINQKHLADNVDTLHKWQDEELIWGIGISLIDSTDEILWNNPLRNTVIHCIDGLMTKQDLDNLSDHGLKLLILGYKVIGRGEDYFDKHEDEIQANIKFLSDNIFTTYKNKFAVIAFDTLATEHFDTKSKVSKEVWDLHFMGEEGSFTFFLDLVEEQFSISSLSTERFDFMDSVDDMFQFVRKHEGFN